ncbi:fructosamine kinase family protein [Sulfurovum sp. XTW-4]|uniref:Fructosamine kinase family protein n=1 Tax=Sulfurovum xiamenensis TaxID=3019066 RepID=A0ABT7QTF0_9BACT|nr:fructosamine kinase family protein [Sulfurovum xiamenensis]MDM5264224.1 fructosamine kinase family protein [Sulfurovum xiamenensis]
MQEELSEALGQDVKRLLLLQQGQIGDIYMARVEDQRYVVKTSEEKEKLAIEAHMLKDLYEAKIRVPNVILSKGSFLVLEHIQTMDQDRTTQEIEAAKLLGRLHSKTNESRMYGYYYDTTIGPFFQKNEQTQYNWTLFLGQMRIMPMARHCYDKGKIPKEMVDRLEVLCRDLYKRIDMRTIYPSLLHGDVWSGNVLFEREGACLIDPAIYYGDKEMELAFIRLFGTFGELFFNTYQEIHPLSDDFYESKVLIYQLYPLLVHVALYGGSYIGVLERTLKRLKI